MTFAVGSLVRARAREWVVLPESDPGFLVLRPLGGAEEEIAGIDAELELVKPATFGLPDPAATGDFLSCRLLRDAVRLGFRSSAGPFRSFGSIAVEPRPYQLVPLLMAMKLDPIRILVADDVGIGKTVEAGLIAAELLARGEVDRLAVLCPPALAEQWQRELREKFHIEAELVLTSTVRRLEKGCGPGVSLFDRHPFVIVSTEFIKSDARRLEFQRACPELVIVDEAHTCSAAVDGRSSSHQRFALVKGLADKAGQHLVLVTATPHSGNEGAFRSLLGLLNPDFANLPQDLAGEENLPHRKRLAAHLVQRRRGDIRHYLGAETDFPQREDLTPEPSYKLSPEYRALFKRVLAYARETVVDPTVTDRRRQRIRWWSAVALLRSLASSPAAAEATLKKRGSTAEGETEGQVDELGAHGTFDPSDTDSAEGQDVPPGADTGEEGPAADSARRRLSEFARIAEGLKGKADNKLHRAAVILKDLLGEGFSPIVFCRFIPTAEYVAQHLQDLLPKGVEVAAVTGNLAPEEREKRVADLGKAARRVLVATDCLSEGVNLQDSFNAVFHYDLAWNPTRHEQREGRVDRYMQKSPVVRVVTFYGIDNGIDGIVLDVLLRKHKKIRSALGVSVSVPVDADDVMKAVLEGLLLRRVLPQDDEDQMLPGLDDFFQPNRQDLHVKWEQAAEREKKSRTLFAQETIKTTEVEAELKAIQAAVGSGVELSRFFREALQRHKASVTPGDPATFDLGHVSRALRDALSGSLRGFIDRDGRFAAGFESRPAKDVALLSRTHPAVEAVASFVLDTALDPEAGGVARRCGVMRTAAVTRHTVLLLLRYRFYIVTKKGDAERQLLAEDTDIVAFSGPPDEPSWLPADQAEALLDAVPSGSTVEAGLARDAVQDVIDAIEVLRPKLDEKVQVRAAGLKAAHDRVREAAKSRVRTVRVEPHLPVDVLGIYVFVPVPRDSARDPLSDSMKQEPPR